MTTRVRKPNVVNIKLPLINSPVDANNISNSIPSKSQFGQTQNVHNQSSEKENSRLEDLVTNQLNKNPFYNLK